MGQHAEVNYNISIDEANKESLLTNHINLKSELKMTADSAGEPPPPLTKNESAAILKLNVNCLYKLFDKLSNRDLKSVSQTCKWFNQVVKDYVKHQRSSSLLWLNNECLHRVFDWLSLEDLHSLCLTCKKLQKISGEYFKQCYPSALVVGDMDGIHVGDIQVNGFVEFIERMSMFDMNLTKLPYDLNNFTSLRQINLVRINLTSTVIETSKEILLRIEIVELIDCNVAGDFTKFLKMCPKLTRLSIRNRERNIIIGTGNQWLLRPHLTLEYLKLVHKEGVKITELKTFFIRNRKIRTFATSGYCLYQWNNSNVISEAKPKFDQLTIDIDCWSKRNINSFCKLLNELHGRGVYKRLHLNTKYADRNSIKAIASLNALERLFVVNYENRSVLLQSLINVKELGISVSCHVADLQTLAITLNKLERIYFNQATTDDIFVFIKNSAQLKEITVECLPYGIHFYKGVLDLPTMNDERKKLNTEQKVTVYVAENIYLATKWAMNNTEFRLIEIKRSDKWPDPF